MSPIELAKKIPQKLVPYAIAGLLSIVFWQAKGWAARDADWRKDVTEAVDSLPHLKERVSEQDKALKSIDRRLQALEERQLDFLQVFYRQIGQWEKAREADAARSEFDKSKRAP